jgi:hypothetical protein
MCVNYDKEHCERFENGFGADGALGLKGLEYFTVFAAL